MPPKHQDSSSDISPISSLNSEAQRLQSWIDRWSTVSLVALTLTIIAGAFTLAAQYFTGKYSKKLNSVQQELLAAKDTQLATDLREKDVRIALADERAGAANKSAAQAIEQAKQHELGIASARAEAEKARLELARLRDPRRLSPQAQQRIVQKLLPYRGQRFAFVVYPDPEPLALLASLDAMLKTAGWERVASQIGVIEVQAAGNTAGQAHDSGLGAFIGTDNRESDAVLLALAAALESEGIACTRNITAQLAGKTPKAITINVGKKP
jgi:hypothetical protein